MSLVRSPRTDHKVTMFVVGIRHRHISSSLFQQYYNVLHGQTVIEANKQPEKDESSSC